MRRPASDLWPGHAVASGLVLLACTAAGFLAAAGCRDDGQSSRPAATAVGDEHASSDFQAGAPSAATQPAIAAMAAENSLIRPLSYRTIVYRWTADPRLAVTATLVTLDGEASARATYNGWFARYGFMAAVERFPVQLGDEAEQLELGWPPLHALIGRTGERFLLVEADERLPVTVRTLALHDIAGRTLAPAPSGSN